MAAILVADDDQRVCEVLKEYLQDVGGMVVQCAHSGTEAARMLEVHRYHLAIIDVGLPGMRGLDLAALAANGNTSVFLITGHAEANLQLRQLGYPYLAKPFTLDALRLEAADALAKRAEKLARLEASAALMVARRQALGAAMAEFARVMDASHKLLQAGRTRPANAGSNASEGPLPPKPRG